MPPKAKKEVSFVDLNYDLACQLMGFIEVRPDDEMTVEQKKAVDGLPQHNFINEGGEKSKFVLTNNRTNRAFNLKRAEEYAKYMLEGIWSGLWNHPSGSGNGEAITFDWNGQAVSAAHRCVGLIFAEIKRRRMSQCGQTELLEEIGCTKAIVLKDTVLVTGLDPRCADTADTHKPRSGGDVLFRTDPFADVTVEKGEKQVPLSAAQKNSLCSELAVAIRLVWLRYNGTQVSGGGKLTHPEMNQFLEQHPGIKDCLLHVYHENGGAGSEGRKISSFVTLGYAAGLLYLMSHQETNRAESNGAVESVGGLGVGNLFDKASEFWTLFAQMAFSEKANDAIKSLHKVLSDNRASQDKFSRDAICTLVIRAWLSWSGQENKWKTAQALKGKLYVKAGDKEVLDLQRLGGLDIDRQALLDQGIVHDEVPIERNSVKTKGGTEWTKGDECFIDDRKDGNGIWDGMVSDIAPDGKTCWVYCDADGQTYAYPTGTLLKEKPVLKFEADQSGAEGTNWEGLCVQAEEGDLDADKLVIETAKEMGFTVDYIEPLEWSELAAVMNRVVAGELAEDIMQGEPSAA